MRKLVLQSDFGLSDGAVSAMKGIAYGVDGNLTICDITHDITAFNIWEASYRLYQVMAYWPEGTVFVSVVDPGVGSERKSVAAKLINNRFVVTPDNGTLTHLFLDEQILELREIDESVNRLQGSGASHTFHGRDVYAFTGARLASGVIQYSEVGNKLAIGSVYHFDKKNVVFNNGVLEGTVDILDVRFGHIWTDITTDDFKALKIKYGENLNVTITYKNEQLYRALIPFCKSFYDVNIGDELVYINSMMCLAVGIHQESFAETYGIRSGLDCKIKISGS